MATVLDLVSPHVLFQCVNLMVPSLINTWKYNPAKFSAFLPKELLQSEEVLYAFEEPDTGMFLFIERHVADASDPGNDAIYHIYRVHPDVYTAWKKDPPIGSTYKYHAKYMHYVYRIIEEERQHMWSAFHECWSDIALICNQVLHIDVEDMAFAFEEANIFRAAGEDNLSISGGGSEGEEDGGDD